MNQECEIIRFRSFDNLSQKHSCKYKMARAFCYEEPSLDNCALVSFKQSLNQMFKAKTTSYGSYNDYYIKKINSKSFHNSDSKISKKYYNKIKIIKNPNLSINNKSSSRTEVEEKIEAVQSQIVTRKTNILFSYNENTVLNKNKYNLKYDKSEDSVIEISFREYGPENTSLKNRRHIASLLDDFKTLSFEKIMALSECKLQKQYHKSYENKTKYNSITKQISQFRSIPFNDLHHKNKSILSKIQSSESYKRHAKSKKVTSPEKRPLYNEDKTVIKLRESAASLPAAFCVFQFQFVIFTNLNEFMINDLLTKQTNLFVSNPRFHLRIRIKLNDFIPDEHNNRVNLIVIESTSKVGLIHMLDIIDANFPTWNIWQNGCLCCS